MSFLLVGNVGQRIHCFLTRTRDFFFVPCLGLGTKEKNSKRKKPSSKLQSFLFKFCNFSMENLVLDQLTISLYMVFFIPITCLLDIVRRNSVFVTHKSERVISHCRWPSLTWSHLSFYCEVSSHWYQRTSLWVVQLGSTVCVGQNSGQVYSDKGYEQEMSHRLDPIVSCLHFPICRLLFYSDFRMHKFKTT